MNQKVYKQSFIEIILTSFALGFLYIFLMPILIEFKILSWQNLSFSLVFVTLAILIQIYISEKYKVVLSDNSMTGRCGSMKRRVTFKREEIDIDRTLEEFEKLEKINHFDYIRVWKLGDDHNSILIKKKFVSSLKLCEIANWIYGEKI